jgi:hypothetical protein
MSLHVVRNGMLTVVLDVLHVLFVGGAGAARRNWYIKRSDQVLTFEQHKSMLACSDSARVALLAFLCCSEVLFSLLYLGGTLRPRRA